MNSSKLINKKIRKVFSDYLIYFITICLCSSLFFSYLTFSSKNYSILSGNYIYSVDGFSKIAMGLIYVISFILVGLIYYVNNFTIKQRAKEFSCYMILGISKGEIIKKYFLETYIIGIIAVVTGSALGSIFVSILRGFIVYYISGEFSYNTTIYIDVFLQTVIYFSIVFFIISVFNIKRLNKISFLEVSTDEKVIEVNEISKVKYILCLAFTAFCFSAPLIVYKNQEYMNRVNKLSFIYALLPTFLPYLSIYASYYIFSYLIKLFIDKKSKTKEKNFNFILFDNLFKRILFNIKGIGTMTLMFIVATYTLIIAPVTIEFANGFFEHRASNDLIIDGQHKDYDKATLINNVFLKNSEQSKKMTLNKEYKLNDSQSQVENIEDYSNIKMMSNNKSIRLTKAIEPIKLMSNNSSTNIEVHNLEENKFTDIPAGMYIIFIGGGIIFFIIAFTILTIQQLADVKRNKKKYKMLYKMGMDKSKINKLINKQVFILFIIPYAFGGLCSVYFIVTFYSQWKSYIYTYIGIAKLSSSILCGLSIILVIFLIYYMASTFMCKNIINDELSN